MEVTDKYVIAYDTMCDGAQCQMDGDGKPTLYDSEADANFELFCDAIAGLDGN